MKPPLFFKQKKTASRGYVKQPKKDRDEYIKKILAYVKCGLCFPHLLLYTSIINIILTNCKLFVFFLFFIKKAAKLCPFFI